MTQELHTFDRKGIEEVKRYVREQMRELRGGQLFPGRWQKSGTQPTRTCVLDGALSAATNALTSPATASASLLKRNSSGNLEDTGDTLSVVNRFEHISLDADTLILVRRVDGEWRVVGADCDPLGSWP